MDFFTGLRKATECGYIKWKDTKQEIEGWNRRKIKGHTAVFGEFVITTIVTTQKSKGLLGTKTTEGYAVEIKEGTEKIVLTSDPNIIQGKKDDRVEIEVGLLDYTIEEWNLTSTLHSKIQKMFHEKPE